VNNRISITWQSYLLFSVISILAVPLALVDQLSPINILYFLGIGLGVTTATGLLLIPCIAFNKAYFSNSSRQKQEIVSVLIIGMAGVIRGIMLHFSIVWFGFTEPINIWSRIATSTTTTLLWFTAITIFVTSRKSFKSNYEAILRKTIIETSEKIKLVDLDLLSTKLDSELLEIEEVISAAFGDDLPSKSKDSFTFAAAHIKNLIEEKIRPLSHRLWIESAAVAPKINLGTSVLASIRFLNIPPLPTSIFLALITILNVGSTVGLAPGAFATLVILLEVFTLLTFFERKVKSSTNGKLILNCFLLLVPGLLLSFTFYISNKYLFGRDFGSLNLIYVIIFLMVAVLVTSFQLVNRDREQLIFMIESELTASGWQMGLKEKYLTQNAAAYLHNLLQSELLAITKQMELSSGDLDSADSLKELETLLDRVNRPIKDDFKKFLNNPIDRLSRLQSAWKGIAEIEIAVPDLALEDQSRNILLVQIVEEAIANAVRHANATHIRVSAELLEDSRVRFSILNNGISAKEESLGLGSAWLDHYAPNSWSRKKLENGSELIFTL
jgi:signal transduction histidine kinase